MKIVEKAEKTVSFGSIPVGHMLKTNDGRCYLRVKRVREGYNVVRIDDRSGTAGYHHMLNYSYSVIPVTIIVLTTEET